MSEYNYVEIDNEGKVISFGSGTNMDVVLKNTKGIVMEVTKNELELVSACKGKLKKGSRTLLELEKKFHDYCFDFLGNKSDNVLDMN